MRYRPQCLSPLTPAKEYIYFNDRVIAVENAWILNNGTFETGSAAPWISSGSVSIGSGAHSGLYGLTMGGASGQGGLVYQDSGGLVPGQMYQVSVWVQASASMTNGVQMWLHDTLGNGAVSNIASPGPAWQQISAAFTATATGKLRIHLVDFSGNTITTWWDDVTVTPLPPNGDFEADSVNPWTTGTNVLPGSVAHSGFYGLTMGGASGQGGLAYQDVAGLIPGQMYGISAWLRASSALANGAQLYLHDTQGNGVVSNLASPGTSWQQISAAFSATSTGKLRIHLVDFAGNTANVWWDDVTAIPLPPNGDFETGSPGP